MWELVLNWLKEQYGIWVIILILLLTLVVAATWWIRGMYEKVKNLPCQKHSDHIRDIESQHGKMSDKIHEHQSLIDKIEVAMTYIRKNIESNELQLSKMHDAVYTQSHSPLKITERGETMMKRVGLKAEFDRNWGSIKTLIENGIESKNPYDINEFCLQQAVVFPEKFLGEDMISNLKSDAYKEGLLLVDYMKVVGVLARDRYMRENDITED